MQPTEISIAHNRKWILRRRPRGVIAAGDLALISQPLPSLADGEVLVRNTYLSIDPSTRLLMADVEQYRKPTPIGSVVQGTTIGVVAATRASGFQPGDQVGPLPGGWEEFSVCRGGTLRPLRVVDDLPLTGYLSVLGGPGLTAYFGLIDVGAPKAGETVVVSAAAGGVGSLVGQIAKILGCRVIGIAGGAEKCRWLTEELGFDGAVDYKNEDVGKALARLCPRGVDVDFENVGGSILDAVWARMNAHGRVVVCGLIADYNAPGPAAGLQNFGRILMRRLTVKGFVIAEFAPRFEEAYLHLSEWVCQGRLKWKVHVVDGLERAPEALSLLFAGAPCGKVLLRL